MAYSTFTRLSVLLLACWGRLAETQQCTPVSNQPSCVCDTGSGIINLTSLASADPSKPAFFMIDGPNNKYKYSYNPCYGFTDGGDCTDTAGCQYSSQNLSTGLANTEAFTYQSTDSGSRLSLQYNKGTDDRITIVWLFCDETADPAGLTALGEVNQRLTYEFNLNSKCACPGVCAVATPTNAPAYEAPVGYIGIVLILLCVAGLVSYFIIGAVLLKVRLNMTGTDVIPNKTFWKAFPFLVKDGCVFTFKPLFQACKKVKAKFTSGYSEL